MPLVWASRSCGYQFGAWAFLLAAAMYVVGFGSPFWTMTGSFSSRHYISSGLWMNCISDNEDLECFGDSLVSLFSSSKPDWLIAVLALQTIGLIGMIIASLFCIIVNYCRTSCAHSRFLEIVGLFSGLCGVVSCAVYIVKTHQAYSLYSWALGLDLGGCSLALLAAAILWCSNPPRESCDTTSGTSACLQAGGPSSPTPQTAVTAVPPGYPPPLTATDSYPAPGQPLYPDLYQQYAAGPPAGLLFPQPTAPPAPYGLAAGGQHPPLDPPPAYSNHGFQQQELHEARSSLRPASAPTSYGTTAN